MTQNHEQPVLIAPSPPSRLHARREMHRASSSLRGLLAQQGETRIQSSSASISALLPRLLPHEGAGITGQAPETAPSSDALSVLRALVTERCADVAEFDPEALLECVQRRWVERHARFVILTPCGEDAAFFAEEATP